MNTMQEKIPDIFKLCTVSPVIVCSKNATVSLADAKYSRDQGIVILDYVAIDKLMQMLNTNRDTRQVLKFIKECQWKYNVGSGNFIGSY